MLTLLLSAPSFACPTVATGTPSSLTFDTAQVAIVREAERTTFSVSINPFGNKQEFALVMPVPEVLAQDEVRTLDPEIFAYLDASSAPMHVSDAGCPQQDSDGDADSDADSDADGDTDTDVDVEANYLVGEYEITILSAVESNALGTWLDDHGYYLPAGADERLAEYIAAGSYFLTAKVHEDAALGTGVPLSPLQISYDSELFAIPIRLATLNSPGEQDMVIYAVTDRSDGRVGVANYPEFAVPDRCVWGNPGRDDFNEFYEGMFSDAWKDVGDAAWTVEFSGGPFDCNPCTGVYMDDRQIADLGFTGDYYDHFMTRIRMRYTTAQAAQDLMLYGSRMDTAEVTAYADDYAMNYSCVETFCDGTPTPGNEGDADTDSDSDSDADGDSDTDTDADADGDSDWDDDGEPDDEKAAKTDEGWGCATVPGVAFSWLGVGWVWGRRRRG